MKYLNVFFLFLFITIPAFPQTPTLTPRFGVEAAGSIKTIDNVLYGSYKTPAFSAYVGFYTDLPIKSDRLYTRVGVGLNITSFHSEGGVITFYYPPGYAEPPVVTVPYKEHTVQVPSISVSAELRYNLFPGAPKWGNLYVALPLAFESNPFIHTNASRAAFKIMGGIGYRYQIGKRWSVEANAGLGLGEYINSRIFDTNSKMENTLSIRAGYTF
ncbi:MAG: hypothetical protein LBJ39_06435 [Tannerellaceae bacterium]|jgi:hypothetical protein|nr:hypothetical protein [Tannerellaceae bacterium]